MAVEIVVEKQTGSFLAPTLPVFVHDDGQPPANLSLTDAINAVDAAAGGTIPESINGVPNDGNPGITRLSHSAFRFQINYREANLRPLAPPTIAEVRQLFNNVAKRREVRWAPEVAAYGSAGLITPPTGGLYGGLVNVEFSPGGKKLKHGAVIDPPPANLFAELAVPYDSITASFGRTVASLIGCVNSTSLTSGIYTAGEIFLYSVHGQPGSTNFHLDIAWSYIENVSNETRGEVTSLDYRGHDYVWEVPKLAIDRDKGKVFGSPKYCVVNEVHPFADLSALGIEPP